MRGARRPSRHAIKANIGSGHAHAAAEHAVGVRLSLSTHGSETYKAYDVKCAGVWVVAVGDARPQLSTAVEGGVCGDCAPGGRDPQIGSDIEAAGGWCCVGRQIGTALCAVKFSLVSGRPHAQRICTGNDDLETSNTQA